MSNFDLNGETYGHLNCCQCGIVFYAPVSWITARRDNGEGFNCPNGHSLIFREPTVDKLRRERDQLRDREAQLIRERDAKNRDLLAARERVAAAQKREVRLKKRLKAVSA